jgi:flagellar biosynthesis protein FlhF
MTKKGVPESLASKLINLCFRALRNEGASSEEAIKGWLEHTLSKKIQIFNVNKSKNVKRTILFFGPAGVGKTTTIAKLAAKAALNQKLKVCLISMDSHRIAAHDQLKKYSELIGVRFEVALTPEGLTALLPKLKDYDRIFIDTKGSNYVSKEAADDFLKQFRGLNLESSLVLAASTDLEINERIMNNVEEVGYDHMILTKLDESHKNGCLWSLGMKSKMPLSYMADGPNIPEDIRKANVKKRFEMVIPN